MGTQGYTSPAPSRQDFENAMDMLEHAKDVEVLARYGMQKSHPPRHTNTIKFRRLKTWKQKANGTPDVQPADFAAQEGQTPTPNTIGYEDVTVSLKHWVVLFKLTSDAELYHQEDIPADMKQLTGETMASLKEKISWGVLRGGTNVIYATGVSRSAVDVPISLSKLRLGSRILINSLGRMTTRALSGSNNFGTSPVAKGWYVFGHSDLESDIRALPGFVDADEYGSKAGSEWEIGKVERHRFILTPTLEPILAAGPVVGTTGMVSVGGSNLDIYPMIMMAADAWCNVALRGHSAISPTYLPAGQKTHSNPAGMFGFVGADFRSNAFRANERWLMRFEVACTAL